MILFLFSTTDGPNQLENFHRSAVPPSWDNITPENSFEWFGPYPGESARDGVAHGNFQGWFSDFKHQFFITTNTTNVLPTIFTSFKMHGTRTRSNPDTDIYFFASPTNFFDRTRPWSDGWRVMTWMRKYKYVHIWNNFYRYECYAVFNATLPYTRRITIGDCTFWFMSTSIVIQI